MIILFDFDGVIADTETQYTEFWNRIGLEYLGIEEFGHTIKGQTLVQIFGKYFDGKIQEITTGEYEITRPGQPLCRIIDDNHLLAVMNIPIADRKIAVPGSEVKIKIDSGKIVSGTVYEVSPQAEHRTGTLRIRVIIDNNKWNLTAGSTGELDYGK